MLHRPLLLLPIALVACSPNSPAPSGAPSSVASGAPRASGPSAAPSGPPVAPPSKGVPLSLRKGKGSFLIDAPLEKIKGHTDQVKGVISLDPENLARSSGEVSLRLASLETTTFKDAKQNQAQSEHARNWMQVGPDSKPEDRAAHEWATFTISSVEVTPARLADAPVEGDARLLKGSVTGSLRLHGVSSRKTLRFVARVQGPVERPTALSFRTEAPFEISLKEHDIRPRDGVGSLLEGALEKIGKKIEDRVQVSLEVEAGS
ncbi:MAG: YceI family protein [Polyangiaceae bacterium]|nr:YceI family protein [Polyangiaceae bacterium]